MAGAKGVLMGMGAWLLEGFGEGQSAVRGREDEEATEPAA